MGSVQELSSAGPGKDRSENEEGEFSSMPKAASRSSCPGCKLSSCAGRQGGHTAQILISVKGSFQRQIHNDLSTQYSLPHSAPQQLTDTDDKHRSPRASTDKRTRPSFARALTPLYLRNDERMKVGSDERKDEGMIVDVSLSRPSHGPSTVDGLPVCQFSERTDRRYTLRRRNGTNPLTGPR